MIKTQKNKTLTTALTIFLALLAVLFLLIVSFKVQAANFQKDNKNLKIFRLPNSHIVAIKENPSSPVVTVDTWIKTGSVNENDSDNGISHFMEHLFFKGTKKYPLGQAERILESLGANYNAATSKDYTHFYTTIEPKHIEKAIELQADMLLNPVILESEMEREKRVVQQEISRSLDNPQTLLFNNMISLLFKQHPYKRTTLGSKENIQNMKREEILSYSQKWYTPANMVTVISGNANQNEALDLIKRYYKDNINKNNSLNPKYKREAPLKTSEEKIIKGNYNSGYIAIGLKGAPAKNRKDNLALEIAASILGSGNSSRLYQNIKERQNLAREVSSGYMGLKDDGVFIVSAEFNAKDYFKLRKSLLEEIKTLSEQGVSGEELRKAKNQIEADRIYYSESSDNIAEMIGYCLAVEESAACYTYYIRDLKTISAKDVQRAAKQYLSPDKSAISVVLPENTNVEAQKTNQEALQIPTVIYQEDFKKDFLSVRKTVLSNGITIIANENKSNDVISLNIFLKGGELQEKTPGISKIIAEILTKGTEKSSSGEIATKLDSLGVTIDASSNADYFKIQMQSATKTFDKALELVSEILTTPALNHNDIEKAKQNIIEAIKSNRDVPLSYATELFLSEIFPNHPYGYMEETLKNSFKEINRQDIKDFYSKICVPENIVISVSGNITSDKLIEDLNRALMNTYNKDTKKESESKISSKPPFTSLKKTILKEVKQETKAAWIVMGWKVPGIFEERDFAALKVINSLLGEGLSSRLFVNLREKQGLAYNVSSAYPTRIDNSAFLMFIGTQPQNSKVAKDAFLKEINCLKTETVDDKEFFDAKQKIAGRFALANETNGKIAHNLGAFEAIGKGYKFNSQYSELINSVTAQEIKTTANKYFNNPYLTVIIAPEFSIKLIEKK